MLTIKLVYPSENQLGADNQQGRKINMNNNEAVNSEIGEQDAKKVYAYEISRDGGINTTYVRADSLEDAQKMAELSDALEEHDDVNEIYTNVA